MLGFSSLSENPISSINKVLELSASMTGLGVQATAAAGTLVGASTMSSSATQTSTGISILVHSASLESTSVASSSAVFVKGSTLETDLVSSTVQTATGVRILVGSSTQDSNFTQTTNGVVSFQFTESYSGPGLKTQTIIQRTTTIESVTNTTSQFSN